MNQYHIYIKSLLAKSDYFLGKDLNEQLQKKFKTLSSATSRKQIQRAVDSKLIKSSSPVTFGSRQFAYWDYNKRLERDMIIEIAKIHRPTLYRSIKIIDSNKGIASIFELKKVGAIPDDTKRSKYDSLEKIIFELSELKIAYKVVNHQGNNFMIYPELVENADSIMENHLKQMVLDVIFIRDILRTLRKINIIDNDTPLYRNIDYLSRGVSHNNFSWDSIAYTKTTGFNDKSENEKHTLVALDIVIRRDYSQLDVEGFLARLQGILNSVKTGRRKVLPIVIYSQVEKQEVITLCHKLGFLTFDLGTIFGTKVYSVIQNLVELRSTEELEESSVTNTEKIEEILNVIEESGQLEQLSALKGDLFEFLFYPVLKLLFPDSTIQHGVIFKEKIDDIRTEYEYDFFMTSPRLHEYTVIELKGYSSSNFIGLGNSSKKNTLKWFFKKTLPFISKKLKEKGDGYKVTASYITTASFKEDGINFLSQLNSSKLKPTDIDCWYDGDKLIALLKSKNILKVLEIVKKYYIKLD